jgi:FkbM family methyltransferase
MIWDAEVQSFIWTGDMIIGRDLFAWRRRDSLQLKEALATLDRYVPQAEMVFVDIGANTGTASLAALASRRFSFAVAIEPDPRTVRLLRANAGLNGYLDRMEIVAAAASDVEGEAHLAVNPFNYGDNVVVSADVRSDVPSAVIAIPCVRLDRVLPAVADFDPSRAFYWIDVQGHEVPAMRGLGELLAEAPAILVEIDPACWSDKETGHKLARMLSATHEWFVELGHGDSTRSPICALSAFCDAAALKHERWVTNILVFGPTRSVSHEPPDHL